MSRSSGISPLVAIWSPSAVTLFDPATQQAFTGISLAEAASRIPAGRELVVGISQRNAFIRTLPIPNVPRVELARIIAIKLVPLLPVGGQEYVSGFRVGGGSHGEPRIAVVGAVRAEILIAVHEDAKRAGLAVRAILPLAFASWLLAKERSLADCAVVDYSAGALVIDVIKGGELAYSRSIPMPEGDSEFQDEIERTFRMADVERLPLLAVGGLDVLADLTDPRPLVQQFADVGLIERSLFSLEPLETTVAREARKRRAIAGRALVAAGVALVLGIYVAISSRQILVKNAEAVKTAESHLRDARILEKHSYETYRLVDSSRRIVETAFHPIQKFSEVIEVLGLTSSPKSWFTGLTLERGKLVLIRGNALDGKTVAKYVADLSQDKRFRGMKLVFANKATIAKQPVVQFAISGRVVGNLPLDEVPNEDKHA